MEFWSTLIFLDLSPFVLTEAEGLAALNRGEGIDFDEVMEEIDAIIDRAERGKAPRQIG